MKQPTVILRSCPEYDVQRIHGIVREGLEMLELRPFGRTLVKPNAVASGPKFPHAFTRPEFLEGVLRALKDRAAPNLGRPARAQGPGRPESRGARGRRTMWHHRTNPFCFQGRRVL